MTTTPGNISDHHTLSWSQGHDPAGSASVSRHGPFRPCLLPCKSPRPRSGPLQSPLYSIPECSSMRLPGHAARTNRARRALSRYRAGGPDNPQRPVYVTAVPSLWWAGHAVARPRKPPSQRRIEPLCRWCRRDACVEMMGIHYVRLSEEYNFLSGRHLYAGRPPGPRYRPSPRTLPVLG